MVKLTVDSVEFQVSNTTGFSDRTIAKHFTDFVKSYDCPAEFVVKDSGNEFVATESHAKGEKFRFLAR